jgi:hypothetical protein
MSSDRWNSTDKMLELMYCRSMFLPMGALVIRGGGTKRSAKVAPPQCTRARLSSLRRTW